MGWETRQRGGRYLYRSVRIGTRTRRIYLGAEGSLYARIHALLDRRQARAKAAAKAARDETRKAEAEAKRLLDEVWAWGRAVAAASLVVAGHYYHHGKWRPVRGPARKTFHLDPVDSGPPATALDRLKAVTARAAGRDTAALADLRLLLADDSGVWAAADATVGSAVACWRARVAARHGLHAGDLASQAAIRADVLVGADPPVAERTLAAAADVHSLAFVYARNLDETTGAAERARLKLLQLAARRLGTVRREIGLVRTARPAALAAAGVVGSTGTGIGPARRAAG